MNLPDRPRALILFPVAALCLFPVIVRAIDKEAPQDPQLVSQLEARAQQASPREQCFLYTELVHSMTELAGQQMLAGEYEKAGATLKSVERYTHLIHLGLSHDTRRLKSAQMLMHHTAYRLGEYLHAAPSEDRPVLQATLKQLDQVQDELLTQVFVH
jgi:hypothetical protein